MVEPKQNPQPDIHFSADSSPLVFVSQRDFLAHKQDFEWQKKILNWTSAFIVGILVVCVLGFITLLLDAWKFHSETNREYTKAIQELRKENYELKMDQLSKRIDQLENKAIKTSIK